MEKRKIVEEEEWLTPVSGSPKVSGAIAERSKACVCSGYVVGVPGSNPAWGHFF